MGIRYYATPVPPEHLASALRSLDDYLVGDEHHRFIRHRHPRPPGLDLDKGWRPLRHLLLAHPPARGEAPALLLVAGEVEQGCCGYRPHTDLLDAEQVAAAALDLARPELDEPCPAEVCEAATVVHPRRTSPTEKERACDDHAYLRLMLERARAFTAELAEQGWGLTYSIG